MMQYFHTLFKSDIQHLNTKLMSSVPLIVEDNVYLWVSVRCFSGEVVSHFSSSFTLFEMAVKGRILAILK